MPSSVPCFFSVALLALSTHLCLAQALPATPGETLGDKPIVLANAVRGHETVLVAGFSREGGNGAGAWMKAIHADPAFGGVSVYQIAMIAAAPSFFRGMIKNGMKKGVSAADQDRFVVLAADEQPWKNFFGVTTDSDPYVALLDAQGKVLWQGHGSAAPLEQQLKAALR